jgi:hypothetical protein
MAMEKDWRSSPSYRYTDRLPGSGAAWEFLRRNPNYHDDWASVQPATLSHGSCPPVPEKARHWGLHFPGGPRKARWRHRRLLAA